MPLNKGMYIANSSTKNHRFVIPKPIDPHL
jgi:hypothetical protein